MIPEIGEILLVVALLAACLQSVPAPRHTEYFVWACTAATGAAFLLLILAFALSDFSVYSVAANSHTLKPMLYKITGTWGHHEGSMLLWVLVLTGYTTAFVRFSKAEVRLKRRVLHIQGAITAALLLFILLTSNPFARVSPAPMEGAGLNPLLQDIGLAIHPPMLYLGYVGFSLVFGLSIAGLRLQKIHATWARVVQPWARISWVFLTLGILLGSWWAYRELGWGGFWFWDPVENASLMPWLAATALLHVLAVLEKRGTMAVWASFLALFTFILSLLGTFLVRSGILTSVHAFANDPARGVFILLIIGIATLTALWVFARYAPRLRSKEPNAYGLLSRESAIGFNNLLLLTILFTVILGTLYPLFLDRVTGMKVSVGAPYFNTVIVPIAAVLLGMMAGAPMLAYGYNRAKKVARAYLIPAVVAAVITAFIAWRCPTDSWRYLLGLSAGLWVVLGSAYVLWRQIENEGKYRLGLRYYGMLTAHVGVGLLAIGISAVSGWQQEKDVVLRQDEQVDMAGYTFTLEKLSYAAARNYFLRQATLKVSREGKLATVTMLYPESRLYPVEGQQTIEADIAYRLTANIYAALGEADSKGNVALRLYVQPGISLLWLGGVLMALGAGLVWMQKKKKG